MNLEELKLRLEIVGMMAVIIGTFIFALKLLGYARARIQKIGFYYSKWRTQPYYSFTFELILCGILIWLIAYWYVLKRDQARVTAQLMGEVTSSSERDILTEKRIAQFFILWTVVIFSFTVPFVKTEFTVWRAENITVEKTELLFTIPRRTAISSGNYYSHDEILEKGTRVRFQYGESDYFYNAYILTEHQYSDFQNNKSSNDVLMADFCSSCTTGIIIPNDGRYWFVLEFADNGTRAHYPIFSVSIVWEELRTIQEPRYFTNMVTLFDFLRARAGVVDHKTITGTRDSISYTIVTITDTEVIVKDEEFNEDFKASTTINETLAHRLDSWYDEINYIISVRTGDKTVAYFVSREDFNKGDIGGRIRYTILRFKTTTIRIIKKLD